MFWCKRSSLVTAWCAPERCVPGLWVASVCGRQQFPAGKRGNPLPSLFHGEREISGGTGALAVGPARVFRTFLSSGYLCLGSRMGAGSWVGGPERALPSGVASRRRAGEPWLIPPAMASLARRRAASVSAVVSSLIASVLVNVFSPSSRSP